MKTRTPDPTAPAKRLRHQWSEASNPSDVMLRRAVFIATLVAVVLITLVLLGTH